MERQELIEHLDKQIQLIKHNLDQIDNLEFIALDLAVHVRVLVHDTPNSTSLLKHLNSKNIDFYDTSVPINSIAYWSGDLYIEGWNMNLIPHIGIVGKHVEALNDHELEIKYFPVFKQWNVKQKKIDFQSWWNTIIFDNKEGVTLTRSELILNAAHTDGGAHVDNAKFPYKTFRKNDVLKFQLNGQIQGTKNIPVYSSIAQIAWELLESIQDSNLN